MPAKTRAAKPGGSLARKATSPLGLRASARAPSTAPRAAFAMPSARGHKSPATPTYAGPRTLNPQSRSASASAHRHHGHPRPQSILSLEGIDPPLRPDDPPPERVEPAEHLVRIASAQRVKHPTPILRAIAVGRQQIRRTGPKLLARSKPAYRPILYAAQNHSTADQREPPSTRYTRALPTPGLEPSGYAARARSRPKGAGPLKNTPKTNRPWGQGVRDLATRNPIVPHRSSGMLPLRLAERRPSGRSSQEPPRRTLPRLPPSIHALPLDGAPLLLPCHWSSHHSQTLP